MNLENKWEEFKKDQRFEWKIEKFLARFKMFSDIDPRLIIRLIKNFKILEGLKEVIKTIVGEFFYNIYRLIIGRRNKLYKPIFIIGLPHSGTTISMKILSMHPYISNFSELNTVWHPGNYLDLNKCEHEKIARDCNKKERRRINNRLCYLNWRSGGQPRVMNKNPNNTVTIEFIKKCFPDCYIIHVIRDGRAVVNSLIHGLPNDIETYDRFKDPIERVNIFPGVKPPNWRALIDPNPYLQHAKQWDECINYVLKRKELLFPNYKEIYYEKLCENPREIISDIWKFAELPVKEEIVNKLPEKLENRNYKYKKNIQKKVLIEMIKIMKNNLIKLGYSI